MPAGAAVALLKAPDARWEAAAAARGWRAAFCPALRFERCGEEALAAALARPFAAVAVTSARAAAALAAPPPGGQPVYAVGEATARALPPGCEVRGTDAGSARALAARLEADGVAPVLFLCGESRRDDLPQAFQARGAELEEVVVYRSALVERLDLPAAAAVAVVFSPKAVPLLASTPCPVAAIGPTTADALRSAGIEPVAVAEEPTAEGVMLSLVGVVGGVAPGLAAD